MDFYCRKIVELYNGRIWVESKLGQGSTFYINLPRLSNSAVASLAVQQAATINPVSTNRGPTGACYNNAKAKNRVKQMAKIMIVEDDRNLQSIYGDRLKAEGHTIIVASDGEEALAVAVKEKT